MSKFISLFDVEIGKLYRLHYIGDQAAYAPIRHIIFTSWHTGEGAVTNRTPPKDLRYGDVVLITKRHNQHTQVIAGEEAVWIYNLAWVGCEEITDND